MHPPFLPLPLKFPPPLSLRDEVFLTASFADQLLSTNNTHLLLAFWYQGNFILTKRSPCLYLRLGAEDSQPRNLSPTFNLLLSQWNLTRPHVMCCDLGAASRSYILHTGTSLEISIKPRKQIWNTTYFAIYSQGHATVIQTQF